MRPAVTARRTAACALCSMRRVTPPVAFTLAAAFEGALADWLACPEMPVSPEPAGKVPEGYRLEWGGQFENYASAQAA